MWAVASYVVLQIGVFYAGAAYMIYLHHASTSSLRGELLMALPGMSVAAGCFGLIFAIGGILLKRLTLLERSVMAACGLAGLSLLPILLLVDDGILFPTPML